MLHHIDGHAIKQFASPVSPHPFVCDPRVVIVAALLKSCVKSSISTTSTPTVTKSSANVKPRGAATLFRDESVCSLWRSVRYPQRIVSGPVGEKSAVDSGSCSSHLCSVIGFNSCRTQQTFLSTQ